jgi:mannan endo-1,4-beta-mannosidase
LSREVSHRRSRGALFVAALLVALSAVGASGATSSDDSTAFVRRYQNILLVGEQRFKFTGLNIYNANSDGSCWYPMTRGTVLGRSMAALTGRDKVVRAWFFQNMATKKGVRNWSAFDHTLAVARAHGVRVVAVLANQWRSCDSAGPKTLNWFVGGYKQVAPGDLVSYRDWAAQIATRYKDDPTILAWQLINEGQIPNTGGSSATCPPNAGAILQAWAADVSGVIKAVDPRHLVSVGSAGGDRCGTTGRDYLNLYALPTIDLCEYHDYETLSPIAAGNEDGLRSRLAQCNLLGKPLFVGESGIPVKALPSLSARAADFDGKFQAQFALGVVGEIVWNWNLYGSRGGYDVGPGDPALKVLARYGTQPLN